MTKRWSSTRSELTKTKRLATKQARSIAKAICRETTRNCVMDTDPDRPPCDDSNCRMFPIARKALKAASVT